MSDRIRAEAASDPPERAPEPAEEPREAPPPAPPPPAETPPEDPPPAGEVLPAVVQQRVDRLIRERYEAQRQLQEYQARFSEMERQRLPPGQVDLREQARAELREEFEAKIFNEQCNTLFAKGRDEYGAQMDEARDALNAVGWGSNRRALEALTQLRDGHRVYRALAQDLDNAARILSLSETARAVELARLEVRATNGSAGADPMTAPNDDAVTRAPDPIRPIGGTSRRSELPLDSPKMTMAEYIRRRDRDERKSRISR